MGRATRRDLSTAALGLVLGVAEAIAMLVLLVPGIVLGSWSVGLDIDSPNRDFLITDARASYVIGLPVLAVIVIASRMQRSRGERASGLILATVATITCFGGGFWFVGTDGASWSWVLEEAPAIVGSLVGLVALASFPGPRAVWITSGAYAMTVVFIEVAIVTPR